MGAQSGTMPSSSSIRAGVDHEAATVQVLLFYVYTPLHEVPALSTALRGFCDARGILGRLLIAEEGVNGTVAGREEDITAFQTEFVRLVPGAASMPWKTSRSTTPPFHDLKVQPVKELVGWGKVIPYDANRPTVKHLTPAEFHAALTARQARKPADDGGAVDATPASSTGKSCGNDFVLVDMRNEMESQLGHFAHAITPPARNADELRRYIDDLAPKVAGKKVLMYCTGGIRCEKAALFLDDAVGGRSEICQLQGGIHEYLTQFGTAPDCQFLGKNFYFDRRGWVGAGAGAGAGAGLDGGGCEADGDASEVGRCQECRKVPAELMGCAVCSVCRFQVLTCRPCLERCRGELFCSMHADLRHVYAWHGLAHLPTDDLEARVAELRTREAALLPLKKRGRNKRRTLRHCAERMQAVLRDRRAAVAAAGGAGAGAAVGGVHATRLDGIGYCRNSGKRLSECAGDCFGFWGGNDNAAGPDADAAAAPSM